MAASYAFECEFPFDELPVFGHGMMAYGVATLVSDGDEGFYVSDLRLDDGAYFDRNGGAGLGSDLKRRLFDIMREVIENDPRAQEHFNEKYAEYSEPVDDDYQYQAWRDRHLDADWREAAE
jgi:hypothetical protein